ncbi:MAG: DUF4288 domain-containing protein [Planctomycetaceae bacterium]|nr:DUF4288 domain-containing protein [Planctomycetaceae bacterium]
MWYSAYLLMKGNSPTRSPAEVLWEESIVLVQAESEDDAAVKARAVGKAAETEYISATEETIRWALERIGCVSEIGPTISTGTEVFSRFLRSSEVESLLKKFED